MTNSSKLEGLQRKFEASCYWKFVSVIWFNKYDGKLADKVSLRSWRPYTIQVLKENLWLYLGVKRPQRESYHSPPSSAEVKVYVEVHLHSPNKPPWHGAQLNHRDNVTFTFLLAIDRWNDNRL